MANRSSKAKRAAVYLRVSTDGQTTANQRQALTAEAERRGWTIAAEYEDAGISGAKARDKRPGLDRLLKDATRGRFDVVMVWAVDRLGRSLADLIGTLQELHGANVDLFLHQQAIDTTTPFGKAMFQMLGVFAEFERSMIQARVNAGLARARKAGKRLGRPVIADGRIDRIRASLEAGNSLRATKRMCGVSQDLVERVKRDMVQAGQLPDSTSSVAPGASTMAPSMVTAPASTAPA